MRLQAVDLPWRLEAYGEAAQAAQLFEALTPFMAMAPYAVRTLSGKGVRFSMAAFAPPAAEAIEAIRSLLPQDAAPKGRVVCSCFEVAESEIDAFVARSASLEALQATLKCGTSCGSCLPELRRKLAA